MLWNMIPVLEKETKARFFFKYLSTVNMEYFTLFLISLYLRLNNFPRKFRHYDEYNYCHISNF